ncbi:MAG: hypothetical protein IIC02_05120 [Planctomycetes bacterium]|nr:hypothetical protein [Planctomycetota bacterium]
MKNSIWLWDRLSSRSFQARQRGSTGWKACPTYFFNGLLGHEKKMSKRGHFIVVDPADRSWLAKLGFASVDQVLKYKPETIAAMSGSSETFPVEVGPANGAPQRIYIKRYRYRGVMARLKGMFRGTLLGKSRARFEYDVLAEMRRRGVPAVRPIAYGEKRSRGFLKACFLITEGVTGATSLDVLSARASLAHFMIRTNVGVLSRCLPATCETCTARA